MYFFRKQSQFNLEWQNVRNWCFCNTIKRKSRQNNFNKQLAFRGHKIFKQYHTNISRNNWIQNTVIWNALNINTSYQKQRHNPKPRQWPYHVNETYSPTSNRQPTFQNIKISKFYLRRKRTYTNIWQKKKIIKTGSKFRKFK